ncbi:MAG: DUF2288 domain-containing protein [Gammaproteobacteria bacterium]
MTDQNEEPDIKDKLNAETGKVVWKELERFYAKGVLIKVSQDLDLVEVGKTFAEDDKQAVERWLTSGEVERVSENDARRWNEDDPLFWATVVAPWVLVQEVEEPDALH